VPGVGHDAAAMFGSRQGRKQIFLRRRLFGFR
jgi:hypothetical protein